MGVLLTRVGRELCRLIGAAEGGVAHVFAFAFPVLLGLAGRIAAVADVCDALASDRPYKPAWSLDAVRAHLVENSGTQFDPACVEALLSRWEQVARIYADANAPTSGAETPTGERLELAS
ncbi:MAG: hypothetical protein MI723_05785 [Caulobacterales bacterium]|nr:hypothetical protein [Caulobacterales bacterium]